MYKKILIPMALDHGISATALQTADALISTGGEVIALHVYETPSGSVSTYLDEATVRAGFDAAKAQLEDRVKDVPNATPVLIKGHTSRSIVDYANENDVDCIVIGSHKPGLAEYLLGSTAARVVRHASCAVHVLRASL